MKRIYLIITVCTFIGCASAHQDIKIIKSDGEITIRTIQVNKGDVVVCDKNGCKAVNP